MRDLERELRAVEVAWPETPDMAAAVLARLEPRRPRARITRRRLAAALAALLLGALAAVEPARSAVLELLGLRSVRIERREPAATPAPAGFRLELGRRVTPAEAASLVGFRPHPPAALGAPGATFFAAGPPRAIHHAYAPRQGLPESAGTGVGLLVTQYAPSVTPFLEKTVGGGARLERLRVDGAPAYFISGTHGVALQLPGRDLRFDDQRLAGNTLLVERDDMLIRIEGDLTRARAVAIARSIPRAP